MQRYDCYPGLLVIVPNDPQFPGVWKITKVNPKNVKLVNEKGRVIHGTPHNFEPAPADATFTPASDEDKRLVEGAVVSWAQHPTTLFVISKLNGDESARLNFLGGHPERRFYRTVPLMNLEYVDTSSWSV